MTPEEADRIERKIADYEVILDAVGKDLAGNDLYLDYKKLSAALRVHKLEVMMNNQAKAVGEELVKVLNGSPPTLLNGSPPTLGVKNPKPITWKGI